MREETQIYARVYDPPTKSWSDLAGEDGRLPIPSIARAGSFTGREDNAFWAPPLTPAILVAADGQFHLLFRRYRDHNPVYDGGFDLYHTTLDTTGWREPTCLSHTAGFPDRQHLAVRMADGGVALIYQFSHLPPTYWHTQDDYADTDIKHSGIAFARYAWGSPSPTVRTIGPGRPEYLRPGVPTLIQATRRVVETTAPVLRPNGDRFRSVDGDAYAYFGDLHTHSNLSTDLVNKDGSPHEHYRWARDLAGWDFYAQTDHVEELSAGAWSESLATTDLYHQPGIFVPLYAMEWTNRMPADGTGSMQDNCVYFTDREAAQQFHYLARQTSDGRDLLPRLDAAGLRGRFFIARHFHGMRGPDVDLDYPANQFMADAGLTIEPLIEVAQHRGPAVPILTGSLARGIRRGVIGGTDHGRPWKRDYAHVTTGVWTAELTRAALFAALFKRRTFVTNGTRIVCDFRLNEAIMGVRHAPKTLSSYKAMSGQRRRSSA